MIESKEQELKIEDKKEKKERKIEGMREGKKEEKKEGKQEGKKEKKEKEMKKEKEKKEEFNVLEQLAKNVDNNEKIEQSKFEFSDKEVEKIRENQAKEKLIVSSKKTPEEKHREMIHQFSQSNDKVLDLHLLTNIPIIRYIDFNAPENYKKFKIKTVQTKADLFNQTACKIQLLLETYSKEEFDKVKFYDLNSDQILIFLSSPNFLNNSRIEKVVEALHHLKSANELKYFKRSDVFNVIKSICLNSKLLNSMKPSYVSSLAYTTMNMKIRDNEIWFSLAEYLLKNHEQLEIRALSTFLVALSKTGMKSPIELDFSNEFTALELPIIKRLDKMSEEERDHSSLSQIIIKKYSLLILNFTICNICFSEY